MKRWIVSKFVARFLLFGTLFLSCQNSALLKALDVTVERLSPDPSWVGEQVSFQAKATPDSSTIDYQFSVAPPGAPFSVVRDFTHFTDRLNWTPMQEGWHVLRVVARDPATGDVASTEAYFGPLSRVFNDGPPVVTSTGHPLVFLYSAPPCEYGYMSVQFAKVGSKEGWSATTPQPCDGFKSENFWIAGLEPSSDYRIKHLVWNDDATVAEGPELNFKTGAVAITLPTGSVIKSDSAHMNLRQGLLLEGLIDNSGSSKIATPVAHKLDGTVVWYYDKTGHGALQNLLRPLPGGGILAVPSTDVPGGLRQIDLAGNLVWETNAVAISQRLVTAGYPGIGNFHHDALLLPSGAILALASRDKTIPGANPDDPVRIVNGDVLVLLDRDFEVLWFWDSFEKLDVNRKAILGETNKVKGSNLPTTEDWLHGNAVEYLADGNIIFSMRSQDWVIKIDFRDGRGTGDVIWRLGKDGDFALDSTDPWAWFSHQHDPHFDGTRLWLFDNGNTRFEAMGQTGNSRGQVYVLDEQARTARLVLNADLGDYSNSFGSAQRLSNGNYSFLNGTIVDGNSIYSQCLEFSLDGASRYVYQTNTSVYRTYRLHDLYHVSN